MMCRKIRIITKIIHSLRSHTQSKRQAKNRIHIIFPVHEASVFKSPLQP